MTYNFFIYIFPFFLLFFSVTCNSFSSVIFSNFLLSENFNFLVIIKRKLPMMLCQTLIVVFLCVNSNFFQCVYYIFLDYCVFHYIFQHIQTSSWIFIFCERLFKNFPLMFFTLKVFFYFKSELQLILLLLRIDKLLLCKNHAKKKWQRGIFIKKFHLREEPGSDDELDPLAYYSHTSSSLGEIIFVCTREWKKLQVITSFPHHIVTGWIYLFFT